MKVACIQLCSNDNIHQNLEQTNILVRSAASEGAQLVLLPENFACFDRKQYLQIGTKETDYRGPLSQFLSELARKTQTTIVGGSIPIAPEPNKPELQGKVYTSSTLWNANGKLVTRYDKCHLFDADVSDGVGAYRESEIFVPGAKPIWADLGQVRIGLSICYDLRFPEYYRLLSKQGVDIFSVPAAFTHTTGKAHWETLLRARAIENQCFVLAANQCGQHTPKRRTWGHSCIISPWGEVLKTLKEDPGFLLADLDLESLASIRQSIPVQKHRRF